MVSELLTELVTELPELCSVTALAYFEKKTTREQQRLRRRCGGSS
jgi:hypothetical protein